MEDWGKGMPGKLVRDKVPDRILAEGGAITRRILYPDEFLGELRIKLIEESGELAVAGDRESTIEEAADVMEVLARILHEEGIDPEEVQEARRRKAETHGLFDKRIFLYE